VPSVEQYDWSKLQPEQSPERAVFCGRKAGTKNFATHSYKEKRKNSKHGAVKTTRKAVDQTIHNFSNAAIINKLRRLT